MDGALTMQILKSLAGTPVLFADVRHYHGDLEHLGPLQLGPARDLVRGAQRRSAREPAPRPPLSRRTSTSRPAAPRSTTSRPGRLHLRTPDALGERYRMQVLRGRLDEFDAATKSG